MSSVTVRDLLHIVGPAAEPFELQCLTIADKRVTAFLKAETYGGVFLSDGSQHHEAVDSVAKLIDRDVFDKIAGQFKVLDRFVRDNSATKDFPQKLPSDALGDHNALFIRAGYYFGLALGLRLAGGAK